MSLNATKQSPLIGYAAMLKLNIKKTILLTLLSCFSITMTGCANYSGLQPLTLQPFPAPENVPEYRIQPGDVLDIKFFYSPDLNETVAVRPDGRISLQLVDDVLASGLTGPELDDVLTHRYDKKLPDHQDLSVIIRKFSDQRVYVAGEVSTPGEFDLKNKMSLLQAITAAGGFTNEANRDTVLIVRQEDRGTPVTYVASLSDNDLTEAGVNSVYALLAPRDIVYVPKSGIAKVNLFMDQYVKNTLMYNGVGLGFTGVYELNNKDKLGTTN